MVNGYEEAETVFRRVWSSPDSDGHGGGVRDNRFAEKLKVLARSINTQLGNRVSIDSGVAGNKAVDMVSYKAWLIVNYAGNRFEVLNLVGRIGGSCSGTVLGESVTGFTVKDISNELLQRVIRKIKGVR